MFAARRALSSSLFVQGVERVAAEAIVHPRGARCMHGGKAQPAPPPPRGSMSTPSDFLSAISGRGRDMKAHESAPWAESWESLFTVRGDDLKAAGLPIQDRRYLLWSLEKYRQGLDPKDFAVQLKPKKKVRGWGPKVQHGIRKK